MTCENGRVNPNAVTKLRLFADSGGYCSNPGCLTAIFVDLAENAIHIGEIAHVISAGDEGPRSDSELLPDARAAYENLVLLCPKCHTIVDKAEEDYPETLLLEWKARHKQVIADAFGARKYDSREQVRIALEPLLAENNFIFHEYGPESDERFNPESDLPKQWRNKIRTKIIPNNRRLLAICDANRDYANAAERHRLEAFRQHVDDFEAKHLIGAEENGTRFPERFETIFS